MVAVIFLCLSLKSVMAPSVTPTPTLTHTHTMNMRGANISRTGVFQFVNNPDEIGKKFHRWTVLRRVGTTSWGAILFECRCDCGTIGNVDSGSLRKDYGGSKSCGCWNREAVRARMTKHGHSANDRNTPTYTSWLSMMSRCSYDRCAEFKDYGGRGIKVCERWHKFENFLADMGERPTGKTLDRYPDKSGNYEIGNCRWATRRQQSNNVRSNVNLTFSGRTQTVAEWVRETGLPRTCITGRIARGWSVEKTLTAPLIKKGTA